MKTSESFKELAAAMCKMQSVLKPAGKDGVNPLYKSRYSDINAVWEALREPLTSNGLSVWQDALTQEGGVSVATRVVHCSGEWVEFGPFFVPLGIKKDAHGIGSATSYAKRYSLCAALGITSSDEDDDGNAACTGKPIAKDIKPPAITEDIKNEINEFYCRLGDDGNMMTGFIASTCATQGWEEIDAIRRFISSGKKGMDAFYQWKKREEEKGVHQP